MRDLRMFSQPWLRHVAQWGVASLIASVQRGTISWSGAASSTATISAVDLSRSVIRFLSFTNSGISQNDIIPRVELTNATTVTALRFNTSANGTTVKFEVIQFIPGIIRSIQRGVGTFASANTLNVTITAVGSLAKTTLEWLGWRFNDATAPTTYLQMHIALTTTTNIEANTGAASTQEFGYQVVEWY